MSGSGAMALGSATYQVATKGFAGVEWAQVAYLGVVWGVVWLLLPEAWLGLPTQAEEGAG